MGPIGSIIRIALRYGVGGIIGYEGDSQLADDPDVVAVTTVAVTAVVGSVTEGFYVLAKRLGYQAQEETRIDIINLKHHMDGLERSVDGIKPTTLKLERVRDRVVFAGNLGQILWGSRKNPSGGCGRSGDGMVCGDRQAAALKAK